MIDVIIIGFACLSLTAFFTAGEQKPKSDKIEKISKEENKK